MNFKIFTLVHTFLLFLHCSKKSQQSTLISSPPSPPLNLTYGFATMTHYDLPLDYIASCGCVGKSTHYPTAAINALAFGSNIAYGHSCGQCYKLTLHSTPYSPLPPGGDGLEFDVNNSNTPSIIVKIVDSCPKGGPWCAQQWDSKNQIITTNQLQSQIHFDLAWPSIAIPKTFFPLDSTRSDYGVWWVQYELVDCENWQGFDDPFAWGSDWGQQDAACCPMRPSALNKDRSNPSLPPSLNQTAQLDICPSYEDVHNSKIKTGQSSLSVPNTSNILSRHLYRSSTNSAISAHASLTAIQAFRNILYFGRRPQRYKQLEQNQQNPFSLPFVQLTNHSAILE